MTVIRFLSVQNKHPDQTSERWICLSKYLSQTLKSRVSVLSTNCYYCNHSYRVWEACGLVVKIDRGKCVCLRADISCEVFWDSVCCSAMIQDVKPNSYVCVWWSNDVHQTIRYKQVSQRVCVCVSDQMNAVLWVVKCKSDWPKLSLFSNNLFPLPRNPSNN